MTEQHYFGVGPGRYVCPLCPELRFRTIGEKKAHLRQAHPRESPPNAR